MAQASFLRHSGPLDETTRSIPALQFLESYFNMVSQDLPGMAEADDFVAWYAPSSLFIDKDGTSYKSNKGILQGMQKALGWATTRFEHKETKLLSGVALLRPGVGVVEIARSFGPEGTVKFEDRREGDLIGDLYFVDHVVHYTPSSSDGSECEEIKVYRLAEFVDGPAEVAGQGRHGRQHWYGKLWWDSHKLVTGIHQSK